VDVVAFTGLLVDEDRRKGPGASAEVATAALHAFAEHLSVVLTLLGGRQRATTDPITFRPIKCRSSRSARLWLASSQTRDDGGGSAVKVPIANARPSSRARRERSNGHVLERQRPAPMVRAYGPVGIAAGRRSSATPFAGASVRSARVARLGPVADNAWTLKLRRPTSRSRSARYCESNSSADRSPFAVPSV